MESLEFRSCVWNRTYPVKNNCPAKYNLKFFAWHTEPFITCLLTQTFSDVANIFASSVLNSLSFGEYIFSFLPQRLCTDIPSD